MVELWLWSLNPAAHKISRLAAHLDVAERERAARFRFEPHATRFVAARGRMREILGDILEVPATRIEFAYGPHGKPFLKTPSVPPLHFNLAHSDDIAILAVSRRGEIGVDIERLREGGANEVTRLFSPQEQAEWQALPPDLKSLGFLQGWTRKEAVVKALGGGLSIPLDSFSVRLSPLAAPQLLSLPLHVGGRAQDWSLLHLAPAEGYVAAVAVAAPDQSFRVMSALLS